VEDEYMYLGDECQHLQVLSYTLGRLMPHLEDEWNTWKMNVNTWKMHVYTWKINTRSWKTNFDTWKMNPLYQE